MGEVNNNYVQMNELEKELLSAFKKVTTDYETLDKKEQTNTWITKKIKEHIGGLGIQKDYEIVSSEHGGGWLYDLAWYTNNSNGFLESVDLVLESELSARKTDGLKFDFEKLLVANAENRVMICFGAGNFDYPANVNSLIEYFEKCARSYKQLPKGSRVIIFIWDDYNTGDVFPHLIII